MGQRDQVRSAWAVQVEIDRLVAKRKAIDERLASLYRTVAFLEGPSDGRDWKRQFALKLGDACRFALRGSHTPRSPTQIRDQLAAVGFPLERYANALACIHTTLRRLAQNGEAQAVKVAGKTAYVATDYLRSPGRLDLYW
jgi:hypothetical protein